MEVLKLLSHIWLTGADVKLSQGDVDLVDYEKTPKEIIDIAINDVEMIQNYLKSWEGESAVNLTLRKMLNQFCGWQHNETINNWLCNDAEALNQFHDWTVVLAKNGWTSIYDDFREYANDESNNLAKDLYKRAFEFAKRK